MSWPWPPGQAPYGGREMTAPFSMPPHTNGMPGQQVAPLGVPPFHPFGPYAGPPPPGGFASIPPPPPPPPNLLHFHSPMYGQPTQPMWPPGNIHNPQMSIPSMPPNQHMQHVPAGQFAPGGPQAPGGYHHHGQDDRGQTGRFQRQPARPPRPPVEDARRNNRQRNRGQADNGKPIREKPGRRECSARDAEMSQNVLNRLGQSLPGSSTDDISRWVAERKRNWPSRANVERKVADRTRREQLGDIVDDGKRGRRSRRHSKKRGKSDSGASKTAPTDALASIAQQYESSEEEEGELVENSNKKQTGAENGGKKGMTEKVDMRSKMDMKDGGVGKKRSRSRRRNVNKKNKQTHERLSLAARQPNLLRMLLQKEIRYEKSVLLQAFRHLVRTEHDQDS